MFDSVCDFLLYNNILHSTTKVSPYKTIMNASDKEFMKKKVKHPKRRLKAKTVSETYHDCSYIRASNYIKIIDKEHVRFHPPRGLQKSFIKKEWIVIGNVIYNKRNYCKIKITEDSIEQKQLVNGSIWKLVKAALKKSHR